MAPPRTQEHSGVHVPPSRADSPGGSVSSRIQSAEQTAELRGLSDGSSPGEKRALMRSAPELSAEFSEMQPHTCSARRERVRGGGFAPGWAVAPPRRSGSSSG